MLLWVPGLALFGKELFTDKTPNRDASLLLTILSLAFFLVDIIVWVWRVVILVKCLGEVQGFSAWKALANLALSLLIVAAPLLLLLLVSGLLLTAR